MSNYNFEAIIDSRNCIGMNDFLGNWKMSGYYILKIIIVHRSSGVNHLYSIHAFDDNLNTNENMSLEHAIEMMLNLKSEWVKKNGNKPQSVTASNIKEYFEMIDYLTTEESIHRFVFDEYGKMIAQYKNIKDNTIIKNSKKQKRIFKCRYCQKDNII